MHLFLSRRYNLIRISGIQYFARFFCNQFSYGAGQSDYEKTDIESVTFYCFTLVELCIRNIK